jgi:hypothetical protein
VSDIQTLQQNLSALPERDQAFASSLLTQAAGRGLSVKQLHWVTVLAQRATGQGPAKVAVGSIAKVVEMIATASAKLKFPAILLANAEVGTIRVSVAGPASREPGSLNVTSSDKGADGRRKWFGRVTKAGVFEPGNRLSADEAQAVGKTLVAFAEDPEGVAAAYGHKTGACCFCGIALTDGRSLAAGYGPVCAGNFGLAWGGKVAPWAGGGTSSAARALACN